MVIKPPKHRDTCTYETSKDGGRVRLYRRIPQKEYEEYYKRDDRVEDCGGYRRLYLRSFLSTRLAIRFVHSCFSTKRQRKSRGRTRAKARRIRSSSPLTESKFLRSKK